MKGKQIAAVCCSMGIFLSGCSAVKSPRDLIGSPRLENVQQEEINYLLDQRILSNAELLAPRYGLMNRSIFIEDVNGDGTKEGFVFYRAGQKGYVLLLVLKEDPEGWKEVSTLDLGDRTLDYFELADLNGDGKKEVAVGLETPDYAKEKELLIYQYVSSGLKERVAQRYEGMDIADYDGDQKPDVLLVTGKRREGFEANLFSFEKNQLKSRSSIELNGYAFHQKMEGGELNDGHRAFFADSKIGITSMLTEIIAYHKGRLVLAGKEQNNFSLIPSRDINHDGITEACRVYVPKGWEEADLSAVPYIESYQSFSSNGKTKKVEERYKDKAGRFYIIIPPEWYGRITVEKISSGIQLRSASNRELLFEIKWASKKSLDSAKNVIKETKDTIFYTEQNIKPKIPVGNFRLMESEF
ncbi:FG-GAP repeat domain-containing protein [Metabacillus sp. RGM 3146]|uniref:FG-GAP repeat domain-containing protein n=1 Tax=Metabacillus sp. RGM 3146 TaxID=3401092 RepID=UPI003B9A4B34